MHRENPGLRDTILRLIGELETPLADLPTTEFLSALWRNAHQKFYGAIPKKVSLAALRWGIHLAHAADITDDEYKKAIDGKGKYPPTTKTTGGVPEGKKHLIEKWLPTALDEFNKTSRPNLHVIEKPRRKVPLSSSNPVPAEPIPSISRGTSSGPPTTPKRRASTTAGDSLPKRSRRGSITLHPSVGQMELSELGIELLTAGLKITADDFKGFQPAFKMQTVANPKDAWDLIVAANNKAVAEGESSLNRQTGRPLDR